MGSTAPAMPERELRAEEELRELKAQLEEAGFSSVSHIRQEPRMWEPAGGGSSRGHPVSRLLPALHSAVCPQKGDAEPVPGECGAERADG